VARAVLAIAALAAACAVAEPTARANGDPASDVLLFGNVYLSSFAPIPGSTAAELRRVVADANARGFRIRVATIGAQGDLGSLPSFWRRPQQYADFLGQELSVLPTRVHYHDRLLVVMPNGYGVSRNGKALPVERRTLAGLQTPLTAGEDVAAGAILAVQGLAAAHGVKVDAGGSGGGASTALEIAGAVVALIAVALAVEIARRRRREA
jgi:hypothetical protein